MSTGTDLLFVYGTLLSTIDHPMSRRLAAESDLLGPATFRGHLYQVSWYPGIVDGEPGDVVHGELVRLKHPEQSLVWLDEFEGVSRGATSVTEPDEYERTIRWVTTSEGPVVAWVYRYRGNVDDLERVSDGHWSA